jgi:hypothetical protein
MTKAAVTAMALLEAKTEVTSSININGSDIVCLEIGMFRLE